MLPFEAYLKEHNLEALKVSVKAGVRYMIIYNAMKEFPITPEHAQQIRQTVLAMTGIPFVGSFALTIPEAVEEQQTLQMKIISKHNLM